MGNVLSSYLACLTRAPSPARAAARALREAMPAGLSPAARRAAAADVFAAASAFLPVALARHASRRPLGLAAAGEVLGKFARDADLGSPDIGVTAQLRSPRLDPRLGGLLGDASEAIADWLGGRAPAPASVPSLAPALSRALAACAPLVLGALSTVAPTPATLGELLAEFPVESLSDPASAIRTPGAPARVFRAVRASALARWMFWLR